MYYRATVYGITRSEIKIQFIDYGERKRLFENSRLTVSRSHLLAKGSTYAMCEPLIAMKSKFCLITTDIFCAGARALLPALYHVLPRKL